MLSDGKKGFVFYASFYELGQELGATLRKNLYEMIVDFAICGIENEEILKKNPRLRLVWTAIRPQIEASANRFEPISKRGAPVGNQNARKQKQIKNNSAPITRGSNSSSDSDSGRSSDSGSGSNSGSLEKKKTETFSFSPAAAADRTGGGLSDFVNYLYYERQLAEPKTVIRPTKHYYPSL